MRQRVMAGEAAARSRRRLTGAGFGPIQQYLEAVAVLSCRQISGPIGCLRQLGCEVFFTGYSQGGGNNRWGFTRLITSRRTNGQISILVL
ncbi:hypothetical protein IQ254_10700 [Nodosilinea sp. LEGE 07088]|uniref:hypothetical protein n=1 Tax=Nodosilinea sp. LEGE 07088 TaxID=2777968 RepID=UPI00187E39F8|nr:hypothetical protein [Nodosilinea sp. LEGE 07088]MBE9137678.1 hypothetical protein [Nodosilinea sp. LEGE 07088]